MLFGGEPVVRRQLGVDFTDHFKGQFAPLVAGPEHVAQGAEDSGVVGWLEGGPDVLVFEAGFDFPLAGETAGPEESGAVLGAFAPFVFGHEGEACGEGGPWSRLTRMLARLEGVVNRCEVGGGFSGGWFPAVALLAVATGRRGLRGSQGGDGGWLLSWR